MVKSNVINQWTVVEGCPSYEPSSGNCLISNFKCSDISLCAIKRIVMECLSCKESNHTGNEAWLLANIILQELMINYENSTIYYKVWSRRKE